MLKGVLILHDQIATSPFSILGNDNDSGRRFGMTLHLMFLFLQNMAGEDTDVLKDTSRNDEQKLHRHCEKTLDEDASYLERTSKGFSWQSPNVEIA